MKSFLHVLLFVGSFSAASSQNPNLYFPPKTGNVWQTTPPAELGFCPDRVDSLYQFLEKYNSKAFLLLKDGRIVLEKYFGSFVQDSVWYWASAGKTLTGFLVGQAQEKGILKISDPTSKYLGKGWTTCPPDKEDLITVRHQLTMTTGLDDTNAWTDPTLTFCEDPSCLKYKADAGTRWSYHNPPYQLIQNVLEKASGQNINLLTKNYVSDRTGMKGLWVNDVFYSTPRTMARFGLLMLGKGTWDGDVLLSDPQYFSAMTTTSQPMNKSYGYLTWLNGKPSFMVPAVQLVFPGSLMPDAPADLYAALGKDDQKIHVVPSKGWVVVRMGKEAGAAGGALPVPIAFDNQLWKYLNALVCQPSATSEVFENQSLVQVFPNPSVDGWQLESEFLVEKIELSDGCGRLLRVENFDSAGNLFFENRGLAGGVYFLKICGAGKIVFKKVLVGE